MTSNRRHKVLLVDDHALFREGLARILEQEKEMQVCGEAASADDALKKIQTLKPDLVIVDVSLGGMSGIELTKMLRAKDSAVKIAVLSMHDEAIYAERALRAGANGYLMKRTGVNDLLVALRSILAGQTYISEALNQRLLQNLSGHRRVAEEQPVETLSDRELEIFQLIGRGYGTRQMADELSISMKTVETHREHIRAKFGLKTTFELVQKAISWSHQQIA